MCPSPDHLFSQHLANGEDVYAELPSDDYEAVGAVEINSTTTREIWDQEEAAKSANIFQTVLTIFKSFVCSGIIFLPRAFFNGGLALSIFGICFSWLVSLHCMALLVECAIPGRETFEKIGYAALGSAGSLAVAVSVFASQLGFSTVLMILSATTVQDFINALTSCNPAFYVGVPVLLLAQLPVHVLLSWVRRIKYFGPVLLTADALLVFCTGIIIYYSGLRISQNGAEPVQFFNKHDWAYFLGAAVYMWEGVGLVLPIRSAMQVHVRHYFPRILQASLFVVLVVYGCLSTTAYLAFGSDIKSVVTANLPPTPAVFTLQIMVSIAIFLSIPLQLFPAIKVSELWLFGEGGRVTTRRKWKKNILRAVIVASCLLVGNLGRAQLDNFVALIGAVCCAPMLFIYPALFHWRLLGDSSPRWKNVLSISVIGLGVVICVFTAQHAMRTWNTAPEISRCPQFYNSSTTAYLA